MERLWDDVASQLVKVPTVGGQRYVDRHRRRGKMLVRERIEALLDPDTPFLELSPLAGWGTQDPIGVGVVTGIGVVEGVECAITGTDMTYRGGSANPTTLTKVLRFFEIARENRLPVIVLSESAGADLPRQADIFVPGGRQFRNLTRLSQLGIPTITVAFGPNTAGGAYVPGMSDYSVFVKERGTAYLGGPPLVKMAIDEIVDEETLGGAEMHSRTSGLSDYLALDEMDALRITRQIVRHLRWRKLGPGPTEPADPPLYDPAELLGCASADVRIPFDIRELYARLLDGSRFEEFKPLFGAQLVCGWGSIHGFPVGLVGNNGILFSEEARKGAQFIQHGIHGRVEGRAGRDHRQRRQADQRGLEFGGPPLQSHGRRQLRRRQLRDGGECVRPAVHLLVAQPQDRRHGGKAARRGHGDHRSQLGCEAWPRDPGRSAGRPDLGARATNRAGVDRALRDRPGVG